MTTLELVLAIVTGLGGLAWVGSVLTKKIESKTQIDIRRMDRTGEKIELLKKTIANQADKIQSQSSHIIKLEKRIEQMQLKLSIIIPIIEKHLADTPENLELLKHLKNE